jgi:hypothetical protein
VQFTPTSVEQAQQFAAWLARHGSLIGQLHLCDGKWQDIPAFEPCAPILVASAIRAAAAGSGLQQLRKVTDSMPTLAMLSALSNVSSLTSLELEFCSTKHMWYSGHQADSPAAQSISKMASALSSLSSLQRLQLDWTGAGVSYLYAEQPSRNPLWQGLSGLQRLTSLTSTYCTAEQRQMCSCEQCQHYELLDVQPLLHCGASLQQLTLPVLRELDHDDLCQTPRVPVVLAQPISALSALTELVVPELVIIGAAGGAARVPR